MLGSNTYLVGTGKQRLLIDTGEGKPSWIKLLKETLQKENATVAEVVITHWHHDHQGGVEHLQEFSPNTIIYKNKPDHLASSDGWLDIEDGQRFSLDGASLRAVFSPGHALDHVRYWEANPSLFSAYFQNSLSGWLHPPATLLLNHLRE